MRSISIFAAWPAGDRPHRFVRLASVVALHAAAFGTLLQFAPVRAALNDSMPIMVSLLTAPVVEKPQGSARPLPPTPRVPRVAAAQTLSTSHQDAPAAEAMPATAIAATAQAITPPPTAATAPVPAPIVPPSFNADYLDNPPPLYPALSRRIGEQGKVVLRVLVSARGSAEKIELRASSGSSRLDQAAQDSVKHWRFAPARQGEQAVDAWVLIPITFSLKG